MQTTLETLGQLERRLHVAVPIEQIDGEVQKRLARLAKTVKVAGFRPGKVPLKMITQQYGPQVRSDVISDTVQSSFNDAIRAQNLRVAGYPRIEPKQGRQQRSVRVLRRVRGLSRGQARRLVDDHDRASGGRRRAAGRRAHASTSCAASACATKTWIVRRGRAIARWSISPVRIDGVEFPGGQAKDFAIVLGEGRMLPEFEAALDRHACWRAQELRADLPRGLSRQGSGGTTARASNLTLHVGRRAASPRGRRGIRAKPSASPAAMSTTFALRSRRI